MNAKRLYESLVGEYKNEAIPNAIEYGYINDVAIYVLGYGNVFNDNILYGVTVLLYDEDGSYKFSGIDSMCFLDLEDAVEHITKLRREGLLYEDGIYKIYRNNSVYKC